MESYTNGPWEASEHGDYTDYDSRCIVVLGDDCTIRVAVVLGADDLETNASARLIASAPAMDIALRLIADGHARIERCGNLREFCFDGIRYCMNGDWNALITVIGWEKAIAKATGEQSCV